MTCWQRLEGWNIVEGETLSQENDTLPLFVENRLHQLRGCHGCMKQNRATSSIESWELQGMQWQSPDTALLIIYAFGKIGQ